MNYRLFLLLPVLAAGDAAAVPASAPAVLDIDRIVAVVNSDVITETELHDRMVDVRKQLEVERIKIPPDDVLKRQLLERMIIERIQLQLAAQAGVRVNDNDVEQAIQTVAARNNMSVEGLYKTLSREGLDPAAYRARMREQLTIHQLLDREINSRITVTDNDINNFLENAKARTDSEFEFNVSHIFIALPESASSEHIQTAKKHAEEVRTQVAAGEDFAHAAVTHSQSPEALKGGSLEWKKAAQLPEMFVTALNNMRPGDISPVLRGPNGFHVVRLNDRRGGIASQPVTQTHVRHILLKPSEIQSLDEARERMLQLRARIDAGEDFVALAKAHSEDTGSASNGGDLGWVEPRQLVPEFEKAMNALAPKQLSEPIRTAFGVHLIQVLDRREQGASNERARSAVRNQIHARKADDRYEQWVRQLRDEAYVEYLLDEIN